LSEAIAAHKPLCLVNENMAQEYADPWSLVQIYRVGEFFDFSKSFINILGHAKALGRRHFNW